MAITLFGTASTPADNGTNTTNPTVVTPPGSMTAGQLVYIVACGANTSGTVYAPGAYAGTSAGGQTWTAGAAQRNASRNRTRCFWCRFNGTWSANPSLYMPGTANNIVRMLVFSGTHGASTSWEVGTAEAGNTYTAPTTPFTVSISGVTVGTGGELEIATWTSADDNTWGTLADPGSEGWVQVTGPGQVRNTSGAYDQSIANAYLITPHSGGIGGVSLNQATLGGDLGTRCSVVFREYNTVSGTVVSNSGANASGTIMLAPSAAGSAVGLSTAKASAGFWSLAAAGSSSVSSATAAAINLDRIESFYNWLVGSPAIGGVAGPKISDGVHVTEVSSYVTSGTSATFNVEERTSPESAGTDILAADQVADADGASTTTIDNADLAPGNSLFLDISATSGSPDILSVTVAYYHRINRAVSAAGSAIANSSAVAKIGDILRTVKGAVISATTAFARATCTFVLAGSVAAASTASAGASGTAFLSAIGSAACTSTAVGAACITNTNFGFYNWLIGSPAIGGVAGPKIAKAATITEVSSFVTAETDVEFNVEIRTTPESAGTNILAEDQLADVDGTSTTTIATPALPVGDYLWLDISAVTDTPDILSVTVAWRYSLAETIGGRSTATSSANATATLMLAPAVAGHVSGASTSVAVASVLKTAKGSSSGISTASADIGSTVENLVKFYNWLVGNPANGIIAGPKLVEGATITEVSGYTTAATYVSFNIQERVTPNVATSALLTSDLQVGTTGASTTAFDDSTLNPGNTLFLDIRSINGTPGILSVTVFYTTSQAVKGRSNGVSSASATAGLVHSAKGSAGSIFATTGDFVRSRFVIAAAEASGTAGAGARVTIIVVWAGSSAGVSSAVAAPNLMPPAFGSSAGTSSAIASASVLHPVKGSASSTSTATLSGLGKVEARGHANSVSTATGFADYKNRGFGHSSGVSSSVAVASASRQSKGHSTGLSTARAKCRLTTDGDISGSSAGTSTATAKLLVYGPATMWVKLSGIWRKIV